MHAHKHHSCTHERQKDQIKRSLETNTKIIAPLKSRSRTIIMVSRLGRFAQRYSKVAASVTLYDEDIHQTISRLKR